MKPVQYEFTGNESKEELRKRLQSMCMVLHCMLRRAGEQKFTIAELESKDPRAVAIEIDGRNVRAYLKG